MPKYNWARPEGAEDWMRIKEQAWWASSLFLNSTDAVIAPSAHIAKALAEHGLNKQCHVLPNGVDVAGFKKVAKAALPKDIPVKGKDIWFTYVGRVADEKRLKTFVEAVRLVANPKVKAVIVGSGPADNELKRLIAGYGLQERVYVLGRREPSTIPAILAHSDVFVLPSYRFDNQPMVILEALAAGLPIIYCDDQLTEGLTKNNALLADTPKPESLAKAITLLSNNPQKTQAMALASKRLAPMFDVAKMAQKIEAVYQQAIANKN